MFSTDKFVWFRDLPSWFAAIGAVGLFVIAFVTLGPVIENLQLRERNLELTEKNKQLGEKIRASQDSQRQMNEESELLKREIDARTKRVESLEEREKMLVRALTQITGNISEQVARERKLTRRIDQLGSETKELQTKKNELENKNSRLERERARLEDQLKRAEEELDRVGGELKNTWRVNRRYILEQIATKVTDSFPIRGEGRWEDYIPEGRLLSYITLKGSMALRELEPPEAYFRTKEPPNGRQLVLAEFGSQVFRLLPEVQKPRFQDAIRGFMNKHSEVFSASLIADSRLRSEFFSAWNLVKRTKGSKYFNEAWPLKPDKVSRGEIRDRESAHEEAKSAHQKDIAKIHSARIDLHEKMESMVVQLTDYK
jgi:hypothetical protein